MDAETYQARLLDNKCTGAAGCQRTPEDGASQCKQHLYAQRKRQRKSMAGLRARREANGECLTCGTPRKLGQKCVVCVARRTDRIPDEAVNASVNVNPADPFRRDNDGWRRYRGKGRRGPRAASVGDEQDLRDAEKQLEAGRKALAYARSPEVQAMPRIQRAGAKSAAVAHLALAAGFVADVVARNDPERARELTMLRTEIAGDGEE